MGAVPHRCSGAPLIARAPRSAGAYALTTFAAILPGHEDELEAYLERAADRRRRARSRASSTLHIARVQIFRELVHQGPKQKKTDTLQNAHLVFTEHDRRRPRPVPGRARRAGAGVRRVVGPLRRLSRAARTARRSARGCARSRSAPGCSRARCRARPWRDVREALALRERVIDFAVEAQGLDAADAAGTLPLRRSDCSDRPPNVPAAGDAQAPRTSTSRTSRATSCAATRTRGGVPVPADRRRRAARALMTRMLPQVMTGRAVEDGAPGDRDERRVHLRRPAALGVPPRRCWTRSPRRSARAWPRAPSTSATAGRARRSTGRRARHRRGARARHGLRGRRGAAATPRVAAVIGADAEQRAVTLVHLQRARGAGRRPRPLRLLRRHRAARGRGRRRAPRARRRPARRRGRLARAGHGRVPARLRRRGRHAARRAARAVRPQRHVRRLPQAAHGPGRVPALHPRRRLPGRPRRARRPRSSAAGRDGTPLSRLARRARRGDRRRPAARSTTSATPTTRTACAARSAPTSAAPTRATRSASSTAGCPTATASSAAAAPTARRSPPGVAEDDGADRGLVFVCFQADIWRQFETIQALWIDDGDPFGLGADKDFLVGEPHGTDGQDDHPGPPAVLPQAAAALRHDARRRVPLPAVDDGLDGWPGAGRHVTRRRDRRVQSLLGDVHFDGDAQGRAVLAWTGYRGDGFETRVMRRHHGPHAGPVGARSISRRSLSDFDVAAAGEAVACFRERANDRAQAWRLRIIRRSPRAWSKPSSSPTRRRGSRNSSCASPTRGRSRSPGRSAAPPSTRGGRVRRGRRAGRGADALGRRHRQRAGDRGRARRRGDRHVHLRRRPRPPRLRASGRRRVDDSRGGTRVRAQLAMDGGGRALLAWNGPGEGSQPLFFAAGPASIPAPFVNEDEVSVSALAADRGAMCSRPGPRTPTSAREACAWLSHGPARHPRPPRCSAASPRSRCSRP